MKRLLLASVAAVSAITAVPAAALTINLIDTGGVSGTRAQVGFKIAALYWESVLVNDAVINLEVGFEDMGDPDVLGSTGSAILPFVPVSAYYDLLSASSSSSLDSIAVSNLSPLTDGGLDVIVPAFLTPDAGINPYSVRFSTGTDAINTDIALLSANAKALGIDVGDVVDASITFNSMFSWDFNPSTGVRDGTYDFIGVAIHEIGHALGFVSGVDDFDYSAFYNGPVDEFWWGYGLDMFRYSDNPQGYGDGGPYLDWSIGTDSYFSIDGGQTALFDGYFSTGSNYGDGWQASHWKAPGTCTPLLGIMNPYACNGYVDEVTGLDLALYDAIGWNLSFDVLENPDYLATTSGIYTDFLAEAIPEPQSWAMMVIGFGAVGLTIRRRKEKAAAAI